MKTNRKGNAALVALLVMIILLGLAAIVMLLGGRSTIEETPDTPQAKTSTLATSASSTVTTPEVPKVIDLYPKKASGFKTTSIKDFTAQASILVDLDDDTILAGHNMDKKIFPASLTKVMTILVACENVKSYEDEYTFKDEDFTGLAEENASVAGFKPGEKVTAKDLLYGAILPSGADACVGLENLVAGSHDAFIKMMNDRAKELGLKNTHFVNSTGIHDDNHYTTVADFMVIMKVANHNVTCRTVLTTFEYTTTKTQQNPEGIKLPCTLLSRISGYYIDKNGSGTYDDTVKLTGGKTGFTDEAGCTIATYADDEENGHTYCCVLAKCRDALTSAFETVSMYEKYLPGSKAQIPDGPAPVTTTAKAPDAGAAATTKPNTTTTKKAA